MLKHGILGLLSYGERTGYEIMEAFRDSLDYFWSAQTSQIYRELQTIEKNGWATSTVVSQKGKPDKKVFSITEDGRKELLWWLRDNKQSASGNSPLLLKTFFRGELPPEENLAFFNGMRESCDSWLGGFDEVEENAVKYENFDGAQSKSLYWKMTIEYGRMQMKLLKEWSEYCIKQIEEAEK